MWKGHLGVGVGARQQCWGCREGREAQQADVLDWFCAWPSTQTAQRLGPPCWERTCFSPLLRPPPFPKLRTAPRSLPRRACVCRCAGPGGEAVRLVCVPSFLASGTLVLLNLRTLEATPMTFSSSYS